MATVTSLVELICEDTGLDNSNPSADRTKALAALNEAYEQLGQQAYRDHTSVDHTPSAGVTDVDLSTVTTLKDDFTAIDHIRVVHADGTLSKPISRLTREKLLDKRTIERGAPVAYAYAWPYVFLDKPADGAIALRIAYVSNVATLSESAGSGLETTPISIPPAWHRRLLARLAKCLVLEGYEGREQDAAYHRNLFNQAHREWIDAQSREGGKLAANDVSGKIIFDTPAPLTSR